MFSRAIVVLAALLLQTGFLHMSSGISEALAQERDAVKLRIYVQPYPSAEKRYGEDQLQVASEVLSELEDCEIVGAKEVLKAHGGKVPSIFAMEQARWALARQAATTMRADYVLIGYRSMDMNNMNFSGTLVNVRTGAVYSAQNTGSSEGMQSANPAAMAERLGRTTYREIIRKAKKDISATLAKKKENPEAEPAIIRDSKAPVVTINSPELSDGKAASFSSVLRITGKVKDESGISGVAVAGKKAALDDEGGFSADIVLAIGVNDVLIEAVDAEGNTGTQRFQVTRQAQRPANRLHVYFQPYPSTDRRFAEDQQRIVSEMFSELENCEVVDSREAQKVFGGRVPSPYEMEENKWALAVRTGKVLEADYVLIGYKTMDMNNMNFSGTLVNVRTGAVYSAQNTGSSEGMQSANPVAMAERLGRTTYNEIIRKAKRDMNAMMAKKREAPGASAYVKDTKAPSIVIAAPEASGGRITVNAPVLAVEGRARDESSVQTVQANGRNVPVREDGSFSTNVVLEVGENEVVITAEDTEGNRGTQKLQVIRQAQRPANKLHVYFQPYPSTDRRFAEDQQRIVSEMFSELENCEVVDSREAQKVFGGRVPSPYEMEENKWALAVRTGKVLEADYVLIGYKTMDMNNMNFSGTLVNVRTGAVYSAQNTGSSEGMQSANPVAMAERLGRTTYNEIIRKAKRDMNAMMAKKRENLPSVMAKTNAPVPTAVAAPTIVITSPDVKRGVKVVGNQKLLVAGVATAEGGVAQVYVNEEKAAIGRNGTFSIELPLKPGVSEVAVVAVDKAGNRGEKTFSVDRQQGKSAVAAKPRPAAATKRGTYHALVIGNNNYKYIPRLETARKDARAIEKVLRENFGFKTKLLLDATRNEILDAVNVFRRSLGESDNFLIYYAGHGEFDRKGDKAYWLPVDAQRDYDTNWIISDDLTTNMKRISARHVLVVADSCYSGALTRSFTADLDARGSREEFLSKMSRRASRTLMASGGNEPVSDSGGSGHSVFADALLTALSEIDHQTFTAEELFHEFIKERVAGRSEQTPEYNTIRNSGHDGGDFVFERR